MVPRLKGTDRVLQSEARCWQPTTAFKASTFMERRSAPRAAAGKRQAVTKLLSDDEWSHWSDNEIARRCEPSPTPSVPEPSPQVAQDNDNGWISTVLWEIERRIDSLPAPQEAAECFPTHQGRACG